MPRYSSAGEEGRMDTERLSPTSKVSRLLGLAKLRQATRWPGYTSIADYHEGAYECDFVSPYTKPGFPI